MSGEKQQLLRWFYRAPIPEGEQYFDVLLRNVAIHQLSVDPIYADAFVQSNARRMWNYLVKEVQHNDVSHVVPIMKIISSDNRTAVWYPQLDSVNHSERRKYLLNRSRPHMLKALDDLTDREYEAAGCVISTLSGADEVLLTPPGNEGGVDFFARIRQPGTNHIFSGITSPFRIVGQCKKYKTKVGVDKVREFATTLNDIRHVAEHMLKHMPPWFRAARGPMIGWIISHSGFQSGAKEIAKNHGILLADSVDLAEILSQSRNICCTNTPSERANEFVKNVKLHLT